MAKTPLGQCKRHGFNPWVGKISLEKEMATHSSILAWRISRTEEPGVYSPRDRKELDMTATILFFLSFHGSRLFP